MDLRKAARTVSDLWGQGHSAESPEMVIAISHLQDALEQTDMLSEAVELIVRDGLGGTIEAVPLRMGGAPTIAGHRFKVSQVLAEIADEDAINDFCDEFGTFDEPSERAKVHEFFRCLVNAFDVTIAKQEQSDE